METDIYGFPLTRRTGRIVGIVPMDSIPQGKPCAVVNLEASHA